MDVFKRLSESTRTRGRSCDYYTLTSWVDRASPYYTKMDSIYRQHNEMMCKIKQIMLYKTEFNIFYLFLTGNRYLVIKRWQQVV